jgi:hypothetical protein
VTSDVGDGLHEALRAAEDRADLAAREASDTAELLRLSILKRHALRDALTDLCALLRRPHPERHPDYSLACRDAAHAIHALLHPEETK